MAKWFRVGPVAGSPMTRYAVVTVAGMKLQVSKPEGTEIAPVLMKQKAQTKTPADVTPRFIDIQQMSIGTKAGEQARRPTWRRAGRRAEGGTT